MSHFVASLPLPQITGSATVANLPTLMRHNHIISSVVKPAYLVSPPAVSEPGLMDSLFDFRTARIQILSGLGNDELSYLLRKGDITDAEYRAAMESDPQQSLSARLPYSQVYL